MKESHRQRGCLVDQLPSMVDLKSSEATENFRPKVLLPALIWTFKASLPYVLYIQKVSVYTLYHVNLYNGALRK